jgi:hypothetical protein
MRLYNKKSTARGSVASESIANIFAIDNSTAGEPLADEPLDSEP